MWIIFAFGSALFAGLTAVLSKIGIRNTDSNVATALRTIVVLAFSWLMVFVVGSAGTIYDISRYTLLYLVLSGFSTGASWLCYFKALQLCDVNKVTPIDKSSTILTMILAFILLGESITVIKAASIVLIGAGTFLMIQKKKAGNSYKDCNMGRTNTDAVDNPGGADNPGTSVSSNSAGVNGKNVNTGEGFLVNPNADGAKKPVNLWLAYAVGSSVFASLTSILGKIGIEGVESNLGTAIRTIVVLIMSWLVVFVTRKQDTIKSIDVKSWVFLILSGFATGSSWLCYYRALQDGPASVVVPIDKLSILVTIAFSYLFLKEKLSEKSVAGLILIVAGTMALLI